MTRTWAEHDRVAIRDRIGQPWKLGTITAAGDEHLIIRVDGGTCATVRHRDDERVVPEHEVPVDERHWLPQSVRDQLVRQEAAGRLREMWAALPDDCNGDGLLDIAHRLDGFDAHGGPDPEPAWAASARRLLATAPQPTTTP